MANITALGFFAVGQFALKIKPNLIWPKLTFFTYGELSYCEVSYSEKSTHETEHTSLVVPPDGSVVVTVVVLDFPLILLIFWQSLESFRLQILVLSMYKLLFMFTSKFKPSFPCPLVIKFDCTGSLIPFSTNFLLLDRSPVFGTLIAFSFEEFCSAEASSFTVSETRQFSSTLHLLSPSEKLQKIKL